MLSFPWSPSDFELLSISPYLPMLSFHLLMTTALCCSSYPPPLLLAFLLQSQSKYAEVPMRKVLNPQMLIQGCSLLSPICVPSLCLKGIKWSRRWKKEAGIAERYFTGKGYLWTLWVVGNGGSYPLSKYQAKRFTLKETPKINKVPFNVT